MKRKYLGKIIMSVFLVGIFIGTFFYFHKKYITEKQPYMEVTLIGPGEFPVGYSYFSDSILTPDDIHFTPPTGGGRIEIRIVNND